MKESPAIISEVKPKKNETNSSIFPDINSVKQEHDAHLDLINKKKDVS